MSGEATEKVHDCPRNGESVTLCCGRSPFELPRTDRMTLDPDLVTCNRAAAVSGGEQHTSADECSECGETREHHGPTEFVPKPVDEYSNPEEWESGGEQHGE